MKIDKLDILFSEYVRRRAIKESGGCERCLTEKHPIEKEDGSAFPAWKQLQCSHFYGRAKKTTRYDPDNATGLCAACHLYLTANPQEHFEFFKKRLGERGLDLLNHRAHIPQKVDRYLIELYLKVKIKELEEEE